MHPGGHPSASSNHNPYADAQPIPSSTPPPPPGPSLLGAPSPVEHLSGGLAFCCPQDNLPSPLCRPEGDPSASNPDSTANVAPLREPGIDLGFADCCPEDNPISPPCRPEDDLPAPTPAGHNLSTKHDYADFLDLSDKQACSQGESKRASKSARICLNFDDPDGDDDWLLELEGGQEQLPSGVDAAFLAPPDNEEHESEPTDSWGAPEVTTTQSICVGFLPDASYSGPAGHSWEDGIVRRGA